MSTQPGGSIEEELTVTKAITNSLGAIVTRIRGDAHALPWWRPAPIRRASLIVASDLAVEVYDIWQEAVGPV